MALIPFDEWHWLPLSSFAALARAGACWMVSEWFPDNFLEKCGKSGLRQGNNEVTDAAAAPAAGSESRLWIGYSIWVCQIFSSFR